VWEMRDGVVERFQIDPADYGHGHPSLDGLEVASAQESADLIRRALTGDPDANRARSIIALNAGAGIYVSGVAGSLKEGIVAAEEAIASGAALDKLDAFADFTQQTVTASS